MQINVVGNTVLVDGQAMLRFTGEGSTSERQHLTDLLHGKDEDEIKERVDEWKEQQGEETGGENLEAEEALDELIAGFESHSLSDKDVLAGLRRVRDMVAT